MKILAFLFWTFYIVGEIICFAKFFDSDFEPSYKREIIYGVSAFTGVGGVVGYMNFPDTPPVAQVPTK